MIYLIQSIIKLISMVNHNLVLIIRHKMFKIFKFKRKMIIILMNLAMKIKNNLFKMMIVLYFIRIQIKLINELLLSFTY